MTHDTGMCIVTVSVANAGPPAQGVRCTAALDDVAEADLARVAEISSVESWQIRGRSRDARAVSARWAWWVLLRERGMSYSRIAKIAGRDHSSVIHALRLASKRAETVAILAAVRE